MTRKIVLSLMVCVSLFATEEPKKEANTLEEAFKLGQIKGQLRALYQSNSKLGGEATSNVLMGGKIGIETAPLYNVSIGATLYTSNTPFKGNRKDPDYYNGDKDYTILGETFVKYAFEGGELKVGRMELDTPLVNSDDIRMIPNLYSAAILHYSPIDKLNITAGVVTQMAGWENNGDHTKFLKMGEAIEAAVTDGGAWDSFFADNSEARESKLYLVGATYEYGISTLQAWYGRQSEILDTYYLEGMIKALESETLNISIALQYMKEKAIGKLKTYSQTSGNETIKIDSDIYGAALELESKATGIKGSLAYNKSGKKDGRHNSGGTASLFGGGKDPLFTSMDVETANGEGDVKAYKGEIGFDFEKIGVDGLGAALARTYFDKKASQSYAKETDFTISYAFSKASIDTMLTNIKSKDAPDNNRLRIFVKYDF